MIGALRRTMLVAMAAGAVWAAPLAAQEVKMEGIIVTHQHGQLTIKTPSGNQTIALAPNVRVRSIAGALGGQKQIMPPSALIPGLPIVVEGTHAPGGHFVAHEVDYKAKDYKVAAQVNAGVEETARREAELRNAYSKMGEWNVLQEKNVLFKTGSATISTEGKQLLKELAREAPKHKGYAISVLGYECARSVTPGAAERFAELNRHGAPADAKARSDSRGRKRAIPIQRRRRILCDIAQGYFIGEPMSAEELLRLSDDQDDAFRAVA